MNDQATINRNKTVTQQIEELILARIERGQYPPDQRMPSEDALAQELQVSRASVRSALGNLTTAGYIRRRHGDGTYPSANVFEIGIRSGKMWDVMRQIQESGRTPELRSLEQQLRPATADEAALLDIDPEHVVLFMKRLFLADGKPVAIISNLLRCPALPEALSTDANALSPFEALARFCTCPPDEATVDFHAISADDELSVQLSVPVGSPLLRMSATLRDSEGKPLMIETEYYPGSEGFQLRAKLML